MVFVDKTIYKQYAITCLTGCCKLGRQVAINFVDAFVQMQSLQTNSSYCVSLLIVVYSKLL